MLSRAAAALRRPGVCVFCLFLCTAAPAAAQRYTITDLGTLPGGTLTVARGLNEAGEVVGYATTNGQTRAFLYRAGALRDLGTLPGDTFSDASAINSAGRISGRSGTDTTSRGVIYRDGAFAALGALPGLPLSEALAINDAGQAVGVSQDLVESFRPVHFVDGAAQDLGTLMPDGGGGGEALAINEAGQIAGYATAPGFRFHAFRREPDGTMVDLGVLPGMDGSVANALNDHGQAAGSSYRLDGPGNRVATLWDGGELLSLGTLSHTHSAAYALNNEGQVVGIAYTPRGDSLAFLWDDGAMVDLNALVPAGSAWELVAAYAINDRGQIAGFGYRRGFARAFLLTPSDAQAGADLSVSVSDAPDPVLPGGRLTYTVTIANNGPDPATGVVATTNLPSGASFLSATASQGSCTLGPAGVACSVGSLAAGASATATIVIAAGGAAGETLTSVTSVTGTEGDPNPDNDRATAATLLTAACAADVTARLRVTRARPRLDPATGNTVQLVTLQNVSGAAIQGPVSLVLAGLSRNAALLNASGYSACVTPSGPYVDVPPGDDGQLAPGETREVLLQFLNRSRRRRITYRARVLAGPGGR